MYLFLLPNVSADLDSSTTSLEIFLSFTSFPLGNTAPLRITIFNSCKTFNIVNMHKFLQNPSLYLKLFSSCITLNLLNYSSLSLLFFFFFLLSNVNCAIFQSIFMVGPTTRDGCKNKKKSRKPYPRWSYSMNISNNNDKNGNVNIQPHPLTNSTICIKKIEEEGQEQENGLSDL